MTTNDGMPKRVIHVPWNAPIAAPTSRAIADRRRPGEAHLRVQHRHDRRAQPADDADGQVDLAEQQDEHHADRDGADRGHLQREVDEVQRVEEARPCDVYQKIAQMIARPSDDRHLAQVALGDPRPVQRDEAGEALLLRDEARVVDDRRGHAPAPCAATSGAARFAAAPSSELMAPVMSATRRSRPTVFGVVRADVAAETQDDDPVGDVEHVLEVVADEDDAVALLAQAAHEVEHLLRLRHAERSGRLVEEHDLVLPQDRSRDRDRLALPAREGGDRDADARDLHRQAPQHVDGLLLHADLVQDRHRPAGAGRLAAEEQVRDHVEVVAQGEVLVDRRDAERGRVVGAR